MSVLLGRTQCGNGVAPSKAEHQVLSMSMSVSQPFSERSLPPLASEQEAGNVQALMAMEPRPNVAIPKVSKVPEVGAEELVLTPRRKKTLPVKISTASPPMTPREALSYSTPRNVGTTKRVRSPPGAPLRRPCLETSISDDFPLWRALQVGPAEVCLREVEKVLSEDEEAAKYPFVDSKKITPVGVAVQLGCSAEVVQLLVDNKAVVDMVDSERRTPLMTLEIQAELIRSWHSPVIEEEAKLQRIDAVREILVNAGAVPVNTVSLLLDLTAQQKAHIMLESRMLTPQFPFPFRPL
eukprot:TRINITY_DN6207_c0_g1_i1.p1 TRINITY_DN6207_c0_g1~~TRINITY_DN6207_c0_g1_i1.p1  ORF type:complete len:295 (+),score=56.99 TRINITY_DN6207_c0_g1_i1:72-956(+)